jgi:hypothetical protein
MTLGTPLTNGTVYRRSLLENKEIKHQTQEIIHKGYLLDQLKGEKYFSKIDLKSCYHEVPIEQIDVWKISFKSKESIFEWLVMPFGLKNAPKNFMRMMDDILRPFTNYFLVVYLDDILIYNKTWVEHL